MHCTMDDLVALRDGEGSVWARKHLDACPACRAELDALYQRIAQLKALPALRPARDRWEAVRAIVRGERERRRRRWGAWSVAAAAAVAGLIVFRPSGDHGQLHAELAQAKQRSALLETELQRYDADGRVISGRAAALAAELEDRIAVVDGALARRGATDVPAQDAQLVELWRARADLMQQLVQVRVTRAAYVGL